MKTQSFRPADLEVRSTIAFGAAEATALREIGRPTAPSQDLHSLGRGEGSEHRFAGTAMVLVTKWRVALGRPSFSCNRARGLILDDDRLRPPSVQRVLFHQQIGQRAPTRAGPPVRIEQRIPFFPSRPLRSRRAWPAIEGSGFASTRMRLHSLHRYHSLLLHVLGGRGLRHHEHEPAHHPIHDRVFIGRPPSRAAFSAAGISRTTSGNLLRRLCAEVQPECVIVPGSRLLFHELPRHQRGRPRRVVNMYVCENFRGGRPPLPHPR